MCKELLVSEIENKLLEVQRVLKAPKGQYNSFGKYKYRSCEDILEAVKPVCHAAGLLLTLSDDVVAVGPFNYVKAMACVHFGEETMTSTAMAREAIEKKGMDTAQITGAASSYARKYALNGLFCIDDTKDGDVAPSIPAKTSSDLDDANAITGLTATSWEDLLIAMKKDDRIALGKTASGADIIKGVQQWEESGKSAKEICAQMIKYFKLGVSV